MPIKDFLFQKLNSKKDESISKSSIQNFYFKFYCLALTTVRTYNQSSFGDHINEI